MLSSELVVDCIERLLVKSLLFNDELRIVSTTKFKVRLTGESV